MHTVYNPPVQLLATALNNLGVGSTIAGIAAPLANGKVGDVTHIGAWLLLGASVLLVAQVVLGRLR